MMDRPVAKHLLKQANTVQKIKGTYMTSSEIQSDSKLLSGFPFINRGNSDNNVESLCIFSYFNALHNMGPNILLVSRRIIILIKSSRAIGRVN
jgi:hypothetical protein